MTDDLSLPRFWLPVTPLSEADAHSAALTVCEYATDAQDARVLLAMLGLPHGREVAA